MDKKIEVNGRTIWLENRASRFTKNAIQLRNEMYEAFAKIGITPDFIDFNMSRNPLKRDEPAEVSWVVNGQDFYYKSDSQDRYVDNLGVLSKVIQQESYAIRKGLKNFGQVMKQFQLGYDDGGVKRRNPYDVLGIDPRTKDLDYVDFKFKSKAKELHPDNAETGSVEAFRELKDAYDSIKRTLGGKNDN